MMYFKKEAKAILKDLDGDEITTYDLLSVLADEDPQLLVECYDLLLGEYSEDI